MRIGIATTYGRPYYRFSTCLKKLDLPFDSILPEEVWNYSGHLVLTTRKESPKKCGKILLHEDILEYHPAIIRGMMMQKLDLGFAEQDLVLGIDPGQRMGLAIFYCGMEIESSVYNSVEELASHIIKVLDSLEAKRKILKIGNGNMRVAKQIATTLYLKFRSSFKLELVDERRTSPKIKNFNQGGKRDMLSAKYISQREGYVHPTLQYR